MAAIAGLTLLLMLAGGGRSSALAIRQGALVLRGVIDGPLPEGLPKAMEVLALSDIPDLSLYGIGSANNGGGSSGEEFSFPTRSLAAGSSLLIASESAAFSQWFGFAPDYTSAAVNVNGNDAFELFLNGAVVDTFGEIDRDGVGRPWEYTDGWACRVADSGPDGTTFQIANWRFSGPNALDDETSNATAEQPYPVRPATCGGIAPPDSPPTVSGSVPANGASGVAPEIVLIVQFSEAVTFGGLNIACADGSARSAPVTGGPVTYSLKPAPPFSLADSCTITIPAANVHDLDGPADGMAADHVFSFATAAAPRAAALALRGVIDGPLPDGMPKAIELQAVADIPDLSRYGLGIANNGEGSDGEEFSFPAAAVPVGRAIFVAYDSASFATWFGFAPDYVSGFVGINGDDAVELFADGEVIDTFGAIQYSGNVGAWAYGDGWACRVANSGPDGTTYTPLHWRFSGINALDDETSNATARYPYPLRPTVCSGPVPTAIGLSRSRAAWPHAGTWAGVGALILLAAACAAGSRRRRVSP